MNSLMEVSDTQAAAGLLGMNAGLCSDIFVGFDVESTLRYIEDDQNQHEAERAERRTSISQPSILHWAENMPEEIPTEEANAKLDAALGGIAPMKSDSDESDDGDSSCWDSASCSSKSTFDHNSVRVSNFGNDCPIEEIVLPTTSYGVCPLYKVDGGERLQPVPYPALYRFRGKDLSNLSRWEYNSIVQVKLKLDKDDDDDSDNDSVDTNGTESQHSDGNKRGRKPAACYEFGAGSYLQASHTQSIRMKLCTPKFYKHPPKYPGPPPNKSAKESEYKAWKKKADKFSFYYLALFRPEKEVFDEYGDPTSCKYDYKEFKRYALELKSSDRMIDRARHNTMLSYIKGWRTMPKTRAVLSAYRGRSRTMWNEDERREARQEFGHSSRKIPSLEDEHNDYDLTLLKLSSHQQLSIMKEVSFTNDLLYHLNFFSEQDDSSSPAVSTDSAQRPIPVSFITPPKARYADELKNNVAETPDNADGSDADKQPQNQNQTPYHSTRPTLTNHEKNEKVGKFIKDQEMSDDKLLAVDIMKQHFNALSSGVDESYMPPSLFITGKPGVGKSFLVNVFDGMAKINEVGDQIRMALFGIAATNIDGSSLISLLDIPTSSANTEEEDRDFNKLDEENIVPWNKTKLLQFQNMFDLKSVSCVIVDEVSTLKPSIVAYINQRLQYACQDKRPYGGKAIVFLGDFDQLPPVKAKSIADHAMTIESLKYPNSWKGTSKRANKKDGTSVNSLSRKGVELFCAAQHIRLTEQHRSIDEEHTALLNKMSEAEGITVKDLKLYKTITPSDKEFEFATILTTANHQRLEINYAQAKKWAKTNNTYIIRWPRKIRERTWKGKPLSQTSIAHAKSNCAFWECFVPDATAYLTHNVNLSKKLANGTIAKYHSISFLNKSAEEEAMNLVASAQPGSVIDLHCAPDFINVELFPTSADDDDNVTARTLHIREQWIELNGSITADGLAVVPIGRATGRAAKWKNTSIAGGGRLRYHASKVKLADYFPIEPGFCITIHKAQVSQTPVKIKICNPLLSSHLHIIDKREGPLEGLFCLCLNTPQTTRHVGLNGKASTLRCPG